MPIVALDRKVAYFAAEQLSTNVDLSPEGYLICRNVIIGRTGFQTYRVSEIADPDNLLGDRYSPNEEIQLWRDPGEVFSPATIASFEGKTFTLTHPNDLLNPDTEREHFIGNVQNVRRGTEVLESGALPLIADIIIKDRDGIEAFKRGMREVSCGYTYELAREGYRWDQRKILGNHVALVSRGRAGAEARINDAAPKEIAVKLKDIVAGWFKTAKPEEIEAALLSREVTDTFGGGSARAIALDAEKEIVEIGKTKDGVSIYANKAEREKAAKILDGVEEENVAAKDKAERFHKLVDKLLSADAEKKEKETEEEAADMEALKDLFGKGEEGEDAEVHPEGCRCEDCMDKGKDGEEEKTEDAEIVREEPVLASSEVPKNAFDAALTMQALKSFRKIVARSSDAKVKKAYDVLYAGFKASLKPAGEGNGSYALFAKAASTASDEKISKATDTLVEFKPKESYAQRVQRETEAKYKKAGEAARVAKK